MKEDYITRVEEEKEELRQKIAKLRTFIESDKFIEFEDKHYTDLMESQLWYMQEYYNILTLRLDILN